MLKKIMAIVMVMIVAMTATEAKALDKYNSVVYSDHAHEILQKKGRVRVKIESYDNIQFVVDAEGRPVNDNHHGIIWMYAVNSKSHLWERIDGCLTQLDRESINDRILMLINDNGLALI